MESFASIFDSYKPLPVVAKPTILDVYGGSAHAPEMREKNSARYITLSLQGSLSNRNQSIHWFALQINELTSIWQRHASWRSWETATRGVLWQMVFLEISQNSQENTCVRGSFFIKLQASGLRNFWEISKNTFFTEYAWAAAF